MTYAEYLKANGATEDEIKILDTPTAQRLFSKQQADIAAAQDAATKAAKRADDYQKWYNEQATPYVAGLETKLATAEADVAAERARVKALQDAGLLTVAADEEAARKAAEEAARKNAVTFDPNKYVPTERFNELAIKAADSITLVADLAQEHTQLGLPPVSWRALKSEAAAANQDVETFWKTKFNVDAKRAERVASERAAYEKKIAEDAIAKFKSEHPVSSVNPNLGWGGPSANPFTGKAPSASDASVPWLKSDNEKVNARVSKVMQAHPDLVS